MQSKVLLVIVNYKSNDYCDEQISSFIDIASGLDYEIIVCNNEALLNPYTSPIDNVKVIDSVENLGYFGSLDRLSRLVDFSSFDFVIVGNADLTWIDLEGLLCNYESNVGIVAPRIISRDGLNQNPHRLNRPSFLKSVLLRVLFSSYWIYVLFVKSAKFRAMITARSNTIIESREVFARHVFSAHGACVVFRKVFFERIESLDMNFFLYGEEDWMAGNCSKHALDIICVDNVVVRHDESVSTSQVANKEKWHMKKEAYIINKTKFAKQLFRI